MQGKKEVAPCRVARVFLYTTWRPGGGFQSAPMGCSSSERLAGAREGNAEITPESSSPSFAPFVADIAVVSQRRSPWTAPSTPAPLLEKATCQQQ